MPLVLVTDNTKHFQIVARKWRNLELDPYMLCFCKIMANTGSTNYHVGYWVLFH